MEIQIIAIGKCREQPINDLVKFYQQRLQPYFHNTMVEISSANIKQPSKNKQKESELLLAKTPAKAHIIALDEHGKNLSTTKFAELLRVRHETATDYLCFIIGGADGLDQQVLNRAQTTLSLSTMTFPHMLVRPILLEQLYRAATLNAGHPYHRA